MIARPLVVAGALVVGACAAQARPVPPPTPRAAQAPDAGLVDMTPAPGADVPSLDDLAARGAIDAPLMHEVKRVADGSRPTELAATADTCFRAVVAANHAVRSWFEDADHAIRGEIADAAGPVPPRGPICAKKGETLRLVVLAPNAGTLARAVVFALP